MTMRYTLLRQQLLCLLLAIVVSAQRLAEDLSFGHKDALSPNGRAIPGWSVSSSNHNPQIMSDRIILTPPAPGNARGALWGDKAVNTETWMAEVYFRASGQDTGTGNLQFWYAKDKNQINIDSVYTAGTFDGLALVIDQYGGRGGGVRGFLNDGTQNFRSHSSLESLAFGHCDYSYRNLGRPSKLTIESHNGLKVSIDDRECFSSDKISLPSGYYFGLTAATSDQPDSFEINKVLITTNIPQTHQNVIRGGAPPQQQQLTRLDRFPGSPEAVPDQVADEIKDQAAQFADLHNRLQGLTHQVANIFGEFDQLGKNAEERHNQILRGNTVLKSVEDKIDEVSRRLGGMESLSRRLESMERNLEQIKRDVEGKDYREHLTQLNQAIESVRGGIADNLPDTIGASKSIHTSRGCVAVMC